MQNSRLGWDIGIGLTISTPLGPVRLDYAVPYMNDEINFSNGKINFEYNTYSNVKNNGTCESNICY